MSINSLFVEIINENTDNLSGAGYEKSLNLNSQSQIPYLIAVKELCDQRQTIKRMLNSYEIQNLNGNGAEVICQIVQKFPFIYTGIKKNNNSLKPLMEAFEKAMTCDKIGGSLKLKINPSGLSSYFEKEICQKINEEANGKIISDIEVSIERNELSSIYLNYNDKTRDYVFPYILNHKAKVDQIISIRNNQAVTLNLYSLKVIFLENHIEIYNKNNIIIDVLDYSKIKINAKTHERYSGTDFPPSDANITQRSYRHTRVDGSRDLRYKDNPITYWYEERIVTFELECCSFSLKFSNANVVKILEDRFKDLKKQFNVTNTINPEKELCSILAQISSKANYLLEEMKKLEYSPLLCAVSITDKIFDKCNSLLSYNSFENHVKCIELLDCFTNNSKMKMLSQSHYSKLISIADDLEKSEYVDFLLKAIKIFEWLNSYYNSSVFSVRIKKLNEKISEINNKKIYAEAIEMMSINSFVALYDAKRTFFALGNYEKSQELCIECQKKIEQLTLEMEKNEKYKLATQLQSENDLDALEKAVNLYKELGDFKDSQQCYHFCCKKIEQLSIKLEKYNLATQLQSEQKFKSFKEAAKLYQELEDYKDAMEKYSYCQKRINQKNFLRALLSLCISIMIFITIAILYTQGLI